MKKKNKSLLIIVVLLLLIGVGSFTYARYITTYNGSGTAQIAKWAVSLKQGGTEVAETFNLNFTLDENENVADGKIAPGRTATANLQLDLTGTEVTADYSLDFSGVTGLPAGASIVQVSANNGTGTVALTKNGSVYTGTLPYSDDNKTINFTIKLEWANSDANNTTDTAAGKAASTLTIPVVVTVNQHI